MTQRRSLAGTVVIFWMAIVPSALAATHFPLPNPNSQPLGIAAGPDGYLYFAEQNRNRIARISLGGEIEELNSVGTHPAHIVTGPDGNLWFTVFTANQIGRITPDGVKTEFVVPTPNSGPLALTVGGDGNLWFTEALASQLGRITTDGVITEFPLPLPNSNPQGITAGPDGNLWFTEFSGDRFGRIAIEPPHTITEFQLLPGSGPFSITSGADGRLWFTELMATRIARVDPMFPTSVVEYPISGSSPYQIARGYDDNLWFTDYSGNHIGRLTPDGVNTLYPLPAQSGPAGVAFGNDGHVWSTCFIGNNIARLEAGLPTPTATATWTPASDDCCQCDGSVCAAPLDNSCGDCTIVRKGSCEAGAGACLTHTPASTPTATRTPTATNTVTWTATPTRTATSTPTATTTPGSLDCCQCDTSSCAAAAGGACEAGCAPVFGASCIGSGCVTSTPTPTRTPTSTPTVLRIQLRRVVSLRANPTPAPGRGCLSASVTAGEGAAEISLDLQFDPTRFSIQECEIHPALAASKTLELTELAPGHPRVVIGGSDTPIPSSQALFVCALRTLPDADLGDYPVRLTVNAESPGGQSIVSVGESNDIRVSSCSGDCDGSGNVTLAELQRGLAHFNLRALCYSQVPSLSCPIVDTNNNGAVTLGELQGTLRRFNEGCPAIPPPRALAATVSDDHIDLAWSNVERAGGFRLLRRLNTAPTGPDDAEAQLVFTGTATEAVDDITDLLPNVPETPRTYYYRVFPCDGAMQCEAIGTTASIQPTLTAVLRAGGYVMHWRHASADRCADKLNLGTAATTSSPDWWKSCVSDCTVNTARQLNATGLAESAEIGNQLRSRSIAFSRVLSSEFCRNFTTANLMNLGPETELLPELTFFVYDEIQRCPNTFALIRQVPAAGTNTAIIGHAGYTGQCQPLESLAWGETAIFKPDGIGGATFITRVKANEWSAQAP